MRPMSRHFAEIHGVDVSDEMIALASRAAPRHSPRASTRDRWRQPGRVSRRMVRFRLFLCGVPACAQPRRHIRIYAGNASRAENRRLGAAAVQRHARTDTLAALDTWAGARFTSSELMEFTQMHDIQLLALEGAGTQYMWTTWRKQPQGWQAEQAERQFPDSPRASAASPTRIAPNPERPRAVISHRFLCGSRIFLPTPDFTTCAFRWAIRWERSPTSAR